MEKHTPELFLDLSEGAVLSFMGQSWRIIRCRGMGRCAKVYHAVSSEGGAQLAIKAFRREEKYRLVFIKEIRNLDAVYMNRHIASVLGSFTHKGHPCLLFELLEFNLKELHLKNAAVVETTNPNYLSLYLVQRLLEDIMKCLQHVHARGWVHADLKPANVMWCAQEGCWKVIDFGHSFQEGHQDFSQIQSFCYQSPEAKTWNAFILQHSNAPRGRKLSDKPQSCTSAVDIWSVGCIVAGAFTGIKLYEQGDVVPGGCQQCRKDCETLKCECEPLIEAIINQRPIDNHIPKINDIVTDLRDLLIQMLQCTFEDRPTASACLQHSFFTHKLKPSYKDLLLLPTRILQLDNVTNDQEKGGTTGDYTDIIDDLREECEKFGIVRKIVLPKEEENKNKAFVEFEDALDCENAQRGLVGRQFDGKPLLATFYPIDDYRSQILGTAGGC
ncbi:serine/threonine-protein kinase Kist-like isoform X2 [Asterias rubens]|uniref:serine/threonine-protein kinase Kist-like isoform X2 n=1 Tax=Asterias rubens TaxID=7604 RepID=UPI001455BB92|nr:serine/threonine-protein kinase Kist-like isoform X2 [Asterias rubens]